jgi:hypothetical protein
MVDERWLMKDGGVYVFGDVVLENDACVCVFS